MEWAWSGHGSWNGIRGHTALKATGGGHEPCELGAQEALRSLLAAVSGLHTTALIRAWLAVEPLTDR